MIQDIEKDKGRDKNKDKDKENGKVDAHFSREICRSVTLSTFFFSWPYPRHVFQCLGYEILSGMGFQINWYYMAFLQLSSWSRCIFYFISLTSTVSSGRVLRRGRPGSTVLTGVRRAAVNRIVPLALVHNLYTPLVTACQGFILF